MRGGGGFVIGGGGSKPREKSLPVSGWLLIRTLNPKLYTLLDQDLGFREDSLKSQIRCPPWRPCPRVAANFLQLEGQGDLVIMEKNGNYYMLLIV